MKQENIDRIKKLLRNASEIKNLFKILIPKWKANPNHYDKTRYGFAGGDGDGWYKPCTLHFQAWAGTYGCSSTYKQIDTDPDVFNEHLIKWLNNHKEDVMLGIAESIEAEASSLKAEAEKELQKQADMLAGI